MKICFYNLQTFFSKMYKLLYIFQEIFNKSVRKKVE